MDIYTWGLIGTDSRERLRDCRPPVSAKDRHKAKRRVVGRFEP